MTCRPLETGWRLFGAGKDAPVSFLPGADRLSDFSDLLGAPAEAGAPYRPGEPLPAAGGECRLARRVSPAAVGRHEARLVLSGLQGRGAVFLDGREAARFSGGTVPVDLTEAARGGRPVLVELRFGPERPASLGRALLQGAGDAALSAEGLVREEGCVRGTAEIRCFRSGLYRLEGRLQPAGRRAAAAGWQPLGTLRVCRGEREALPFRLPAAGASSPQIVLLRLLRLSRGEAPCARLALFAGAGAAPRAWLPLSREEAARPLPRLLAELARLRVPAVSFPDLPEEETAAAFGRAGIGLVLPGGTGAAARFSRFPAVRFSREEAAPSGLPETARQLLGRVSLCAPVPPGGLPSGDSLLRAAFGAVPENPDALQEALSRLLLRMRADAAQASLYAGPVCPPGALGDPAMTEILAAAASPHAAAVPFAGAWWCGAHFSCDLLLLHAAPGASGCAALLDGDRVLAEAAWRNGERARLDARLPEEPSCLRLRLTMIPPDGLAVRHPDLPVFVGRRAPLEAALNLRLSV